MGFQFFSSRLFSPEAPRTKLEKYADRFAEIPMAPVQTPPRPPAAPTALRAKVVAAPPVVTVTSAAPAGRLTVRNVLPMPGQASLNSNNLPSVRATSRMGDQWLGPWAEQSNQSVYHPAAPTRRTVRLPTQQGVTRLPLQHWFLLPNAKITTDLNQAGYVDRRYALRCANYPNLSRTNWVALADGLRPLRGWLMPEQWQAVGHYLARQPAAELQQAIVQLENIVQLLGPGAPGLQNTLQGLDSLPQGLRAKYVALVIAATGAEDVRSQDAQGPMKIIARMEAWRGHPALGAMVLVDPRIGSLVLGVALAEQAHIFDSRATREECLRMLLDMVPLTTLQLPASEVLELCAQWVKWPVGSRAINTRTVLRELAVRYPHGEYPASWDEQTGPSPRQVSRLFATTVASETSANAQLDRACEADVRKLINRLPLFGSLSVHELLTQLRDYLSEGWKNPAADTLDGEVTRRTAALMALHSLQFTGAKMPKRVSFTQLHTLREVDELPLPTLLALICREGAKHKDPHVRELIAHGIGQALARCMEAPGMPGVAPQPVCAPAIRLQLTATLYGYGFSMPGERQVHLSRGREVAIALATEFQLRWPNRAPSEQEALAAWKEGYDRGRGVWWGLTEDERLSESSFTLFYQRLFDAMEWARPEMAI